jgi:hypothetical protein
MRLVVRYPKGGERQTRDIAEMNAFLARHQGKRIAMWGYGVSHSELELRLCHSGGPQIQGEDWLNTVIYCGGSQKLIVPKMRWNSNVIIKAATIEMDDWSHEGYFLEDVAVGFRLECWSVRMYFDVLPGL